MSAVGAVWCEVSVNARRACLRLERGVEALENYQGADDRTPLQARRRETVLAESAVELIADLLHWSAAGGHDPDDILDRAQMHYEAESEAA